MSGKETHHPSTAADFARWIIERLSEGGHQALLAGGCVRDRLLGKRPKDYDVATSATPDQVRAIFGHRRTIPVGAAFGVITVIGDKETGNVEVATFRYDGGYSDGRHPDHVTYSNAEHDAQRRDFTINGLFFDPLQDAVVDYVQGQVDLDRRLIRAIGNPHDRFNEDHLRMLRAVRFATVLDFEIELETLAAIQELAHQILTISGERIAAEMQRLLASPRRGRGLSLLDQSGLLLHLLPQWNLQMESSRSTLTTICQDLDRSPIAGSDLEVSLSIVTLRQLLAIEPATQPILGNPLLSQLAQVMNGVVHAWKLSNESKAVFHAIQIHLPTIACASQLPWSQLQPTLIAPKIHAVLDVAAGLTIGGWISDEDVELCRRHLSRPIDELNPPPLLTGDELKKRGFAEGPRMGRCLAELRRKQLDQELSTPDAAWDWVRSQL
ncbi:MAG: CCA tRNA nucleotidyltransferase [Pirellulaceae bacterium]|nr:CCA tRNA nucleotidyltransferase [Pirellulaceae bacterium]